MATSKLGSAVLGVALVVAVVLGVKAMMFGQVRTEKLPAPAVDEKASGTSETAVFAGGCFWGVQTTFERIRGVEKTWAGYSGGTKETANYGAVSSETTGHAESVKVVFDPSKISYGTLLRVFFSVVHDPTQLNRQGPDVGTSYAICVGHYHLDRSKKDGGSADGMFSLVLEKTDDGWKIVLDHTT
jgi:peptide-methionine (S)-S-oxide reductase